MVIENKNYTVSTNVETIEAFFIQWREEYKANPDGFDEIDSQPPRVYAEQSAHRLVNFIDGRAKCDAPSG